MKYSFFTKNNLIAIIILTAFALIRVVFPQISIKDFALTSLGALMVFSGTVFQNKPMSILLSIGIVFITDLIINTVHYNNSFYYEGMVWVYATYLMMAIASSFIMKKATVQNALLSTITITLIHWVFTSIAYWAAGSINVATGAPLQKTFSDLMVAHIQAIPFELPLLSGTALFSAIMFVIYYYFTNPKLAYAKAQ